MGSPLPSGPPPAAPTPPPGISMPPNAGHTATLLSLLKFGGAGGHSSASQAGGGMSQPHHHQQQHPQQTSRTNSNSSSVMAAPPGGSGQQLPPVPQQPPSHSSLRESSDYASAGSGAPSSGSGQLPGLPPRILQPVPSSADPTGMLAALMRGHHDPEDPPPRADPQQMPPPSGAFNQTTSPNTDTRQMLLDLLNRPKPLQNDQQQQPPPPQQQPALLVDVNTPMNLPPSAEYGGGDSLRHMQQQQQQQQQQHQQQQQQYQQAQLGQSNVPQVSHMPSGNFSFESVGYEQTQNYSSYPPSQDVSASNSHLYSYGSNPFDDMAAASSQNQNRTPNAPLAAPDPPSHPHGHPMGLPPYIMKKPQSAGSGSQPSADHMRHVTDHSPMVSPERRLIDSSPNVEATPNPSDSFISYGLPDAGTETVAEALHDVAEQADREMNEALARAEQDRGSTELSNGMQGLRSELEPSYSLSDEAGLHGDPEGEQEEEPIGLLEHKLQSHFSQEIRQLAEEAKAQAVAESWESADADEAFTPEARAQASVRVFNFPMKPWISISLREDGTEPRPTFGEKSVMDIAKLKKEFDQIDRNLFTASENYMVYGMSKAGGLRVIRQEDARDSKIFTDTQDRIFNVSMSVTPADHTGVPREAIIGTGISGTVYWVQVREGDKDHLDEVHPEQYGFALPPISTQDGDQPGGALKTRARPSTIHPEFFAVGRGKTISIVWPAYIMNQNLFKPGHDRVVDADRLAKQCSLKINTGKAGKDFTFSQDDTVVVSLDKSGRVKFWDVRGLTAIKEGSDPRYPYPAETAMEVNKPLWTLNSTPEGERAWGTSVLLLDKLRPYQKRCALRYMIVGMKQNHTLQLWDLALGKPVQEFNLPHSKESDAVCSVMYHAPTGMLVIGHPTRNSIYFAHLSAPKYNIKNVSQVEYIQRLVAQDPTMPQPDSTAVISGVREYSLANKGTLRSLDILSNPATTQDDSGEPTLFELYAMHSRGVTCLLVKQAELGWSKENKVIDGVDAVEAGVAIISKLTGPAPLPATAENVHLAEDSAAHLRLASRPFPKDSIMQTTPSHDDSSPRRGPESGTPIKLHSLSKDDEPSSAGAAAPPSSERVEKKGRKKKASNVEPSSNGNTNSPRATPATKHAAAGAPVTQEALDAVVESLETRLNTNLGAAVEKSVSSLLDRVNQTMQARDVDFDSRQLKLLEMVSTVLNDNTQKVLEAKIQEQFAESVIPTISDVASKAVGDRLKTTLNNQVAHTIQKEFQKALPDATRTAMHSPEFIKAISDRVSGSVVANVHQELVGSLVSRLTPVLANVTIQGCQRIAEETQQQQREEFDRLRAQHHADTNKIGELAALVSRLSDKVSTMVEVQSQFQGDFLKFQQVVQNQARQAPPVEYPMSIQSQVQSLASDMNSPRNSNNQNTPTRGQPMHPQTHTMHSVGVPIPLPAPVTRPMIPQQQQPQQLQQPQHQHQHQQPQHQQPQHQPQQPQQPGMMAEPEGAAANKVIQQMEAALRSGKYDDAILLWMQSGLEGEIFVKYLHKLNPIFIRDLTPLMLLSMAASISMQLDSPIMIREKIMWLEMAIHNFHAVLGSMDDQTREVTPRTMSVVIERTENIMMQINGTSPSDPILKNLSQMVVLAKRSLDAARAMEAARGGPTGRYE